MIFPLDLFKTVRFLAFSGNCFADEPNIVCKVSVIALSGLL